MTDVLTLANDHILRTARLLERRRFEFLFGSGTAEAVVAALLPYRNPDGGFGNALEPDCRAPGSQPLTTLSALAILDEVGAVEGELVRGICDYLVAVTAEDGGLPFVHPSARGYPVAPWWHVPDTYQGSLVPTANVLGLLHKNKVDHPWMEPAEAFCWRRIDELTETHPYEALGCLAMLDHHPDRARAQASAERLGARVREGRLVRLTGGEPTPEGYTEGELPYPHTYASRPESLARQWFSTEELESGLDQLAAEQTEEGGWPVPWRHWTPAIVHEWGAWLTIEALEVLRAYGRLTPAAR
ncbi:hypothetical protein [Actinophytocola xanthii]|uniref:Prenyltransferase n=1 Tax=Actinophytocola xanthii TaxID=1912961 RepID=A0A1Q8CZ06_9PSEU|nr:hypothetical protein [Actinophytocola xanthii]OLF19584.1 hypothetical protein BU204_01315 [Actinophytocola xanthii]